MSSTEEYFNRYRSAKEQTSNYLNGKKFNTQGGDKGKQIFFIRLMGRIPNQATDLNDGPFYEFWVHRNCGPDRQQALVCMNKNRKEFKSNAAKCPACNRIGKILSNDTAYSADVVQQAKDQKAQNRVLWPVYDLSARKEIEFLEVSGKANDKIIDEFYLEGVWTDLTNVKIGACIQLTRTGSGFNSEYAWKSILNAKYMLTSADVPKIKASYRYPELAVIRNTLQEFKEIFESQFEVESGMSAIDDGVSKPADMPMGSGTLDDLAGTPAPALSRSRGAPAAEQPAQAQQSQAAAASDAVSDLEKELGGIL